MASMGIDLDSKLHSLILPVIEECLEQSNAHSLPTLIWSMSKVGMVPGKELEQKLYQRVSTISLTWMRQSFKPLG